MEGWRVRCMDGWLDLRTLKESKRSNLGATSTTSVSYAKFEKNMSELFI